MADGDSLAKSGTYTEIDNSAVDADVDDDFFVDKWYGFSIYNY